MDFAAPERRARRRWWFVAIALAGFLAQMGLQRAMRPFAIREIYLHMWSSEDLMQTVSIVAQFGVAATPRALNQVA